MSPEDAITASLAAAPRPLSLTELTHPVRRATGAWVSTPQMMSLLSRLVARRQIVRRPVTPADDEGSRALRGMNVALCDFHPAGRDPWPYGIGGVEEWLPCPACGVYVTDSSRCGEPCEGRA